MKNNLVTVSEAPTQLSMVSVPFTGVDGAGVSLYDFNFENRIAGEGVDCDFVKIWYTEEDGNCGYNEFFYYEDAEAWITIEETPFEVIYEDGLPAGTAFWYEAICDNEALGIERPGPLAITFAGAVESVPDVTFNLVTVSEAPTQLTMVANPYPVAWSLYDTDLVEITNNIPGEGVDCDFVKIWYTEEDGNCGYNEFFYYADAESWITIEETPFEVIYEDGLPAGTAFWYEAICDNPELGIERPGQLSFKFFNPMNVAE